MTDSGLDTYPVHKLDMSMRLDDEQMGTKEKDWLRLEGENWLFKRPRKNTGEHWAEKAARELARLIELPAARVELATVEESQALVKGTASASFVRTSETGTPLDDLVHGNELIGEIFSGYNPERSERKYEEHRVDRIFETLDSFAVKPPYCHHSSRPVEFWMVGYLMFDGWIVNTDRHHENWAVIRSSSEDIDRLAPTFDHASSLGRLLDDSRRLRILNGADMLDVRGYIDRSKAAGEVFPREGTAPVPPFRLVRDLVALGYKDAVTEWLERLENVEEETLRGVFERFPDGWMSKPSAKFALRILQTTPQLMREEFD